MHIKLRTILTDASGKQLTHKKTGAPKTGWRPYVIAGIRSAAA